MNADPFKTVQSLDTDIAGNERIFRYFSTCEEETLSLGRRIGGHLEAGHILSIFGTLGSGKTLMTRGISEGVRGTSKGVRSPTFTLIHQYSGPFTIYHVDLYRIDSRKEMADIGLDELLSMASESSSGAVIIEWAEKLEDLIPESRMDIHIQIETPETRTFLIQSFGARHRSLIHAISSDSDTVMSSPTSCSASEEYAPPIERL